MATSNVKSDANQQEANVSQDQWSALKCPQRKPGFLFDKKTRDFFDSYFGEELTICQNMFGRYFKGSDEERSRAEKNLKDELPYVVASEGWLRVLGKLSDQDWLWNTTLVSPAILCCTMPWLIAKHQWWYSILAAVTGAIGALILLFVVPKLGRLFQPVVITGSLGLLVMQALAIGSFAALYAERPTGWEFLATAVAAFWLFCVLNFTVNLVSNLAGALISRMTAARYFNTELSYCILRILSCLSDVTPEKYQSYMANKSYYVGKLIEQYWRRLLIAQTFPPALQQKVRDTIRCFAAGMYEVEFEVTFPTKNPGGENSESKLVDIMASQLTALTTFRYGDLFKGTPQEVSTRPRLQKALHGLRSIIAAIAPVTLLLVLPKAFNFTVSASLYGTLLVVSLAWLAIYVIGWLDPMGLTNVASLTNVTGLFKRGN